MFTPKINPNQQYQMYVAGQWRDSKTQTFLPNINPAHKTQVLGQVSDATDAEVGEAMQAARPRSRRGGLLAAI